MTLMDRLTLELQMSYLAKVYVCVKRRKKSFVRFHSKKAKLIEFIDTSDCKFPSE